MPGDGQPISGAEATAESVEDRAEIRYRVRIRAALLLNGRNVELGTENVSPRGVFLRSNDPVSPRQLVRLRLVLPPHDEVLVVPAMVVHAVGPAAEGDVAPGFGVRFVGLDGEPRERWSRFIRYVDGLAASVESDGPPLGADTSSDPELTPYRPLLDLAISVDTVDELEELITQEISRGRVLIPTEVAVPSGTPVRVHLVHPITQEAFILDGTVSRWTRTFTRGLATVELVRLAYEVQRALSEFACGISIDSNVDLAEVTLTAAPSAEDLGKTREAPFFGEPDVLAAMRATSESKTKLIPAERLEELCDELRVDELLAMDAFDDKTQVR